MAKKSRGTCGAGVRFAGHAAGAAVSTLAGVFAPVFPMPKPTGPYRVGKTTRLWIDRNRRSWLLKTKRKLGAQALPEHRMMMVNIWYPARREDDGSGKDSQPPWPADEEAEARFAERAAGFAAVEETAANATPRHTNVLKKQREETAKHQAPGHQERAPAPRALAGPDARDDAGGVFLLTGLGGGLLPAREDGRHGGRARGGPAARFDETKVTFY